MNLQVESPGPDDDFGDVDDPTAAKEEAEDALSNFRAEWQSELKISPASHLNNKSEDTAAKRESSESEAKLLFQKGIEMEKSGKLYEAIHFYRKAVQLVPDIEFKLDTKSQPGREQAGLTQESESEGDSEDSEESEEVCEGELLQKIQKRVGILEANCIPKNEQKSTHISALPVEMMLYILKWVVSSDLDLRSLEIFSMVCRGFYLCARDSEIWRLACLRVWGLNCGSSPHHFLSWRHMFIERTRLHFNGCYIGKTTYIRHGENSFQDQSYRPWHLVSYYRYLRFFPDGMVLVLTSSDEPAQCVRQMHRGVRSPILKGYYRLKDDHVTVVVQRQDANLPDFKKNHKRKENLLHEPAEQTFHMDLQIKNGNKKRHAQLVWTHYSVFTRTQKGDESTCNFDVINNRFPPFWFSRVKSYTAESESPLE